MGSFAPTFTKIEHFTHLSSSRNVGAGLALAQYLILPPPGISYYAPARLYPMLPPHLLHPTMPTLITFYCP